MFPTLFFSDLLPRLKAAYLSGDTAFLVRAYAFAEWCARDRRHALWNAAGVGFYEHLLGLGLTVDDVAPWLSPATYADIRGLVETREKKEALAAALRQRRKPFRHLEVAAMIAKHQAILTRGS